MKALNNFKVQQQCVGCEMRSANFFCNLSESALQGFEKLKITNAYPKGATLFMEGHPSNGIFMLCQGRVKLSTCSRDGKVIILRVAEPGEVLGLSATVSNLNYETTAEVIESCQVNFVRKDDFLRFIAQNAEACFSAVKQLSYKYHTAYTQVRSFGLSHTAADKLTKLLLEWCKTNIKSNGNGNGSIRLKISYTHEEIAEMIGTSRETVTRLFKDFRDRELITLKGSDLIIHDPQKLDATIGV
jgi:CRP/FNR family transcriptional regulator, cyclic AMP receptor protein